MDAPLNVTAPASESSLIRGGPFYRAQQTIGLIRANRWDLGRRIAVLIGIAWLPLFLITALSNPAGLRSLLTDYRVHSRVLIAIPALLVGDLLMDSLFRASFAYIRQAGLLGAADSAYMDGVVTRLVRLRDAYLPELIVLALLILHDATSYRGLVDPTPWLGQDVGSGFRLTAAGWYAVVVSAPLWNFLLGLALWRWLLWTFFVFKLSRQNLKLIATHPDERGGLGFLDVSASAFAPIAFAVTNVVGSTWRHDILRHGARLNDFRLPAIVLAVLIALIAFGPLLFFGPRLAALRRRGLMEYGVLGQIHSEEFQEKWIVNRAGHEREFLQAPESSTLADFGNSFEKIAQLKPLPADMASVYVLAASVAIPLLAVVLAQMPLAEVIKDLVVAIH
ncbi:hypothetical protein [Tunturiibacter lichenicola]|uniref:hypothetical protein n=1 Tax=Tunturiibacter lichenicola TaxID=2051959 RepID=UPI0021B4AC3E|nr:hypothetical protein [Edaphobacter lichenicola]